MMVIRYLVRYSMFLWFLLFFNVVERQVCGADEDGTVLQEQEYKQDREKIESLRRSFKPGPVNDLEGYERFAEGIQAKWRHRNKEHYARLMKELCGAMNYSGYFKERRRHDMARQYALSALETRDAIPLTLELELTGHIGTDLHSPLGPTGEEFAQRRKKDVEVRLHAWKRLLDAIDPEWDPDEVLWSDNAVSPPAAPTSPPGNTPPGGVDPASISDPARRAQYEEALRKNREKNAKWDEQYRLRDWLKRYPPRAEKYIIDAYSKEPYDLKELKEYLDKYLTDKMTKTRTVETVKANMRERKE